jgi:hypothetical protein
MHLTFQDILIGRAYLIVEVGTLEMVVDDQQGVAPHLQVPCGTAVVDGAVRDTFLADYREPGMDANPVEVVGVIEHQGVVIGISLFVVFETIPPPCVIVLLDTDDVGILSEEIVTNGLKSLFVLVVATIATDIVADDLKSTVGNLLCPQVKGHIYSNRYVGEGETQQGNPDHAELEDDPE